MSARKANAGSNQPETLEPAGSDERIRATGDTMPSPQPQPSASELDVEVVVEAVPVGQDRADRCLTDDEVIAFCGGQLSSAELANINPHVDHCNECWELVREALQALGRPSSAPGSGSALPTSLEPGTWVAARYRIARFIKRGGMGEVYEAHDRMLDHRVALKTVVSTACDSPRAIRKLKAELQLARSIRHPHVCSVFDFWEHTAPDGGPSLHFFTMEFIEGETLGERLRRGALPVEEVLLYGRQLLLGLRAAHHAGVVHRDFKSDNVMLRPTRRGSLEAVVMDFGLALDIEEGEANRSTDNHQLVGSVSYMAPEQVEGRQSIGPEADIFALGVVLFEMLTGQLPYQGDSPWAIATRRLRERAPAPSRVMPGLSSVLDEFVLRCLQQDPRARFADAGDALAGFENVPPLAQRPRRRARGWVTGAVALGVGAALLVLLTRPPFEPGASRVTGMPYRSQIEIGTLRAAPVSLEAAALEAAALEAVALEDGVEAPPDSPTIAEQWAVSDPPRSPTETQRTEVAKQPLVSQRRTAQEQAATEQAATEQAATERAATEQAAAKELRAAPKKRAPRPHGAPDRTVPPDPDQSSARASQSEASNAPPALDKRLDEGDVLPPLPPGAADELIPYEP